MVGEPMGNKPNRYGQLNQFRYCIADFVRQGDAPGIFEFLADLLIRHGLVARIYIGQSAHITGPLNIVLSH